MAEIDPLFVTVKEAARLLGVSTWTLYQRLDQQAIESQYEGRKRLVSYPSLKAYAANLPTTAPTPESEAS